LRARVKEVAALLLQQRSPGDDVGLRKKKLSLRIHASEVETFLKRIDQQLKTPVIKKKKSGKRKPFSPQSKVM
jgi:hypothetical protein